MMAKKGGKRTQEPVAGSVFVASRFRGEKAGLVQIYYIRPHFRISQTCSENKLESNIKTHSTNSSSKLEIFALRVHMHGNFVTNFYGPSGIQAATSLHDPEIVMPVGGVTV